MTLGITSLLKEFEQNKNQTKAKILSGFFKTGKGQYGEGDIFLGITVPKQREIAKKYKHLDLTSIQTLLESKIHEHRLTGLIILTYKYNDIIKDKIDLKNKEKGKKEIFDFYIRNTKNINNWDLVDVTCYHIVGEYHLDKNRKFLYSLAKSTNLWEKRISIISTFAFIRKKDFKDTLNIAELLLKDKHDLIHKAVGWMLREIGKRDEKVLKNFLDKYYKTMPRTMLRYAIEKLTSEDKEKYMNKLKNKPT
ncbi:MAG: DNA alkylation repair protein [Candidatus Woesearchaeota archaeon]